MSQPLFAGSPGKNGAHPTAKPTPPPRFHRTTTVLVGLILNAAIGWWWADSPAGLVIVYNGFQEGRAAWEGGGPGHREGAVCLTAVGVAS